MNPGITNMVRLIAKFMWLANSCSNQSIERTNHFGEPMKSFACIAPILSALVLCGCASTSSPVRVDQADVDLSRCQTFDWLQPSDRDAASLTDQRVRTAVLAELERKGYALSADNPDCRVSYVLSTVERPRAKPSVGVGAGGGSGGLGGGIGVRLPIGRRDAHGGTITLDVVDVTKKAQIWSGSLDRSFEAAELTEKDASEAVREIMQAFPDKK
jgi:hypothetical protein